MTKNRFDSLYSNLILELGLQFEKGMSLVIRCAPDYYSFAAKVAKDAYKIGAINVEIDISDAKLIKERCKNQDLELISKLPKYLEEQGLGLKVAVNISGIQLLDENFSENIFEIINEAEIKPKSIGLEITESVLLNNFDIINARLRDIKESHIDIALDDFGTGYSSFFRLRELNVNFLKIDKSFIEKISLRKKSELISSEIIAMAHKFNLKVIAEGVENEDELIYLKENNCDIIQGYLFSKPISESKIITLLRSFETTSKDLN